MAIKRKAFKITVFIVEIILIISVFLFFYLNTKITTKKIIFIPQGTIKSIVAHLSKEGYDINRFDSFVLRVLGSPQQGWIDIGREELSKGEFLYRITKAKAATKEITFIPGDTTYVILTKISEIFGHTFDDLQKTYNELAPFPDGVIFADTYKLPMGFSEKEILGYIVDYSMRLHRKIAAEYLKSFNQNEWFRLITIASIIEKEAANTEEMSLVSSVIHNRLKKGMRLQMDGALNYGIHSNEKITGRRIREDNSDFNTYKKRGLPPYPVSIVSKEAILAALFPTKSNFLYFVKNREGRHTFSNNYASHRKAIKNGN